MTEQHNSPAVEAAILEERRLRDLETGQLQIGRDVREIKNLLEVQNGRISSNERAIEAVRDAHNSLVEKIDHLKVWARLDALEDRISAFAKAVSGVASSQEAATRRDVAIIGSAGLVLVAVVTNLEAIVKLFLGG